MKSFDPENLRKSHAYKQAFEAYMRTGEPIRMNEVKARARGETQDRPTTHYIWRTQDDGKVRDSHDDNNGKIFAWDAPPPTGHPGHGHGCRCWAEAVIDYPEDSEIILHEVTDYPEVTEFARQTLTSAVNDKGSKWGLSDFYKHYTDRTGTSVTLQEIGHLQGIIDYYSKTLGVYERVNSQIANAARGAGPGSFQYDFSWSYNFILYSFSFGEATVSGLFEGTASDNGGSLEITGTVTYNFHDVYTDLDNERQRRFGTSDPDAVSPEILRETDKRGTHYTISDEWVTRFEARVNADPSNSKYKFRA